MQKQRPQTPMPIEWAVIPAGTFMMGTTTPFNAGKNLATLQANYDGKFHYNPTNSYSSDS